MGWTKKSKKPKFYKNLLQLEREGFVEEVSITEYRKVSFHLVNLHDINGIDTSQVDFSKYVIQVRDNWNNRPTFEMLNPKVIVSCPHVYNESNGLCIFHRSEFSWNRNSTFGKRLILILYAWIFFYDIWCSTKIWYGPEHPHELK